MDSKSILNTENYKKKLDFNIEEVYSNYIKLMDKYNTTVLTSINIINHQYFKYIYLKGIESLTHIFNFLIFYTKNMSLTYHHCEKSLFYYIEFIGQIGDDNHTFLQLNSKDAVLFIYKKTIFDIDDNIKKNINISESEKIIIDKINIFSDMYKNTVNIIVNSNNIDNVSLIENRNNLYLENFVLINDIFNIIISKNKNNNTSSNILYCYKITKNLLQKKYDLSNTLCKTIFNTISKQFEKKKGKLENIYNNINSNDFDIHHNNNEFIKNYLIS